MKNWQILLLLGLSSFRLEPVLAHGTKIEYSSATAITIRATYDDGTPMKQAQAVVYAPDNPSIPWAKGITDDQGEFTFIPNREMSGNWDIKVRQSGHGSIVSIPLQNRLIASQEKPEVTKLQLSSTQNDLTPLQKIMVAAASIWGFIGTALFFSRKPANEKKYGN